MGRFNPSTAICALYTLVCFQLAHVLAQVVISVQLTVCGSLCVGYTAVWFTLRELYCRNAVWFTLRELYCRNAD